jgi:hypothetical protein
MPDIDEDIPLPKKATEAMPDLTPHEELEMRVNTMKLLADLTGTPISPSAEHQAQAIELAKEMTANPKLRPEYARYPNEVMAYLAGMVQQSNCMLVDDLAELKMYVINKLVYEVEHAQTTKDRLTALRSLGEVDGVDAFKKRSETTLKVLPIEEVERELLTVLDNIEYTVMEEPQVEYSPQTDA